MECESLGRLPDDNQTPHALKEITDLCSSRSLVIRFRAASNVAPVSAGTTSGHDMRAGIWGGTICPLSFPSGVFEAKTLSPGSGTPLAASLRTHGAAGGYM